jgi:hypothetical protein
MILAASNGQRFRLRLLGYQFPTTTSEYWDANWLQVQIEATHPRGSWSATDPSLLTFEVASLATWLDSLAVGVSVEAEEEFTEPHLSFHLVQAEGGPALRVYFELEARPPWAPHDGAGARDLWLEFLLAELDLAAAASSLRAQLAAFPERGKR